DEFASLPPIIPNGPIAIYGLLARLVLELLLSVQLEAWVIDGIVPIWLDLASRLMPNGHIMVNCAEIEEEKVAANGKPQLVLDDSVWMLNSTIKILSEAFPGQ
ncbi:hypothetical protein EUTSA_v10001112mg, partial [Eutrema salsugineum]